MGTGRLWIIQKWENESVFFTLDACKPALGDS